MSLRPNDIFIGRIVEVMRNFSPDRIDISRGENETFIAYDLEIPGNRADKAEQAVAHGFEQRDREALKMRREYKHAGVRVNGGELISLQVARHHDTGRLHTLFLQLSRISCLVISVTNDYQFPGGIYPVICLEQVMKPLFRGDPTDCQYIFPLIDAIPLENTPF